jgi:hypothetical protein
MLESTVENGTRKERLDIETRPQECACHEDQQGFSSDVLLCLSNRLGPFGDVCRNAAVSYLVVCVEIPSPGTAKVSRPLVNPLRPTKYDLRSCEDLFVDLQANLSRQIEEAKRRSLPVTSCSQEVKTL